MSLRMGLLALLAEEPGYGYQLRARFEVVTGQVWPVNIGQVYSTLARLSRDGMVENVGADENGHTFYRLTDAGTAAIADWFATPVRHRDRPRDELAVKLALAVTLPDVDVANVVQAQRVETLRLLQDYTRLKAVAAADDTAWLLVLESLIFAAEAEARWLDHCEAAVLPGHRREWPIDASAAPRPARRPARGSSR